MIYFLIPVFNERENLKSLAESLINCLPDHEKHYVFVDDFSTDKTVETLKNLFPSHCLEVLVKNKNEGPGDSFNVGFNWILENHQSPNDKIVTLEGDNTSDISILPKMIQIADLGFELVLASVYAQGGGFDKTSFARKVISFIANILLRFFFDIKVQTLSSFYRVYHVELLKKTKKKYGILIQEKGFISMIEILIKAIRTGGSVIEIPTKLLSSKRFGKSKMKLLNTFIDYIRFLFKFKRIL
jgi:glycosyltransferase involved in cell wall biosynthesis